MAPVALIFRYYLLLRNTPPTQQRLFFSICVHSRSSFAVENNWRRPHPPERSSKIGIWIEKFRCQNSNLNLPTIKTVFTVIRILKIRYVLHNGFEHSFGIVGSCRSRTYAWIVPQRKTHGEPVRNVHTTPIRNK